MMNCNKHLRAIDALRFKLPKVVMTCFIVLGTVDSTGFSQTTRKSSKAKESKIAQLESRVDELEADYYQTCKTAKVDLIESMDEFIAYVDKMPGIAVDVRLNALTELRAAKTSFDKNNSFTAIPAFQGIYQRLAGSRRNRYLVLIEAFDKLRVEFPAGDGRRDSLEKRVTTVSEHYTLFDSLKLGSKWTGFRSDFKMPPRLEITPAKMGQIEMFRKVQDRPVNVDFGLKIEKRNGKQFSGVVSQDSGHFQAEVDGVYDGVDLEMWMVRMKKGAERKFQYTGQLVGGSGFLYMQGFKTNKAFTAGTIYMSLK